MIHHLAKFDSYTSKDVQHELMGKEKLHLGPLAPSLSMWLNPNNVALPCQIWLWM